MIKIIAVALVSSALYSTSSWASGSGSPPDTLMRHELILLTHASSSAGASVTTMVVGSFADLEACRDAASHAEVIGGDKAAVTFVCVQAGRAGDEQR
jgi:citrate lyase beta subunit